MGNESTDVESNMTTQTNRKVGWSFWLEWTMLSALSWLWSYALYLVGRKSFGSLVGNVVTTTTFPISELIIGLLVGALIGFLAGKELTYFLTRYGYSTRRLEWITVGGGVVGFIAVTPFVQPETTAFPFLAIGAVVGVIVGAMQWFQLRRRFYQAGWWIVASAIAWAFGVATVFAPKVLLLSALLPFIAGAATGFVMKWLLNHPK